MQPAGPVNSGQAALDLSLRQVLAPATMDLKGDRMEKIVIFGWGAQGRAQGLNLRDSGMDVSVMLRKESPRRADALKEKIGLITDGKAAAKGATIAAILIPDREQPSLYSDTLEPGLPGGAAILFAHGFAVHYKEIKPRPDLDVILVGPMAPGQAVREDFEAGKGVACAIAVAQDATGRAKERALAYAKAICRSGPFLETTFAEEVESDLFAEQAVLCGGIPELIRAAFDTLTSAGISKEMAYFSCLKELSWLGPALARMGIAGMRREISETARYGALTRGTRVIDDHVRRTLAQVMSEIRSGKFFAELKQKPNVREIFLSMAREDDDHPIEGAHREQSSS